MLIIKKMFCLLAIILFLGSCAVSPSALNDLQEEKNDLEIQVVQLNEELQTVKMSNAEMEKQIYDMNRLINNYKKLINVQGEKRYKTSKQESPIVSEDSYVENAIEKKEDLKNQFLRINSINNSKELYLLGENLFSSQYYRYAILTFEKFINYFPKNSKVPTAHLLQSIALIKLGKNQEAEFFLTDVINKFPQSEEAQQAEKKLAELK